MLFTPRLFEYKTDAMDFSAGSATKVTAMYADIAYCAAINLWTLKNNRVEDFQLERVDFHEWAALEPTAFGKIIRFSLEALTNKTVEELVNGDDANAGEDVKKKTSLSIIAKLKRFLSAIVG